MPENHGSDILWATEHGMVGVQRKEVKDLVASMGDGRLSKEVAQMQSLWLRVLIIEGRFRWTRDGEMVGNGYGQGVTRKALKGFLWSIRSKGIWVEFSNDEQDTVEVVGWLRAWSKKDKHTSLLTRPGPGSSSGWGKASEKDYALHLLTSLPGIGPGTASKIFDHFGKVPMRWTVTSEELMAVDGVGPVRAKKMQEVLE